MAALLWAAVFVGAGYFCGRALEHMLGEFANQFSMVMLGLFTSFLVIAGIVHRRRRRRRAAAAAPSPSA
jgi:LPXTG-motif cell wall-anchored protein